MKKHIFKIILGIILFVGIALFSFRHVIVGHALKITISKKTNETISLKIGNIYYDILNSSVSFSNSELVFSNTYINEEKTIELSELKFDKIQINNLSILRLLFKREVVANKFIIAKPSLWFMENHNPKPFKEKPKEIINSLNQHHDILKNLVVIVNEIEITHGKVDLKSLIDNKEHSGSVEFKLLLKKINTSKKQNFDNNTILFAEEHFVKLSSFNYMLPNGDKISFDSIIFDSKSNNLITSNLSFSINSDTTYPETNPITAKIGNILLSGIGFEAIEDLHNLEFENITISDGYLHLTNNHIVKSPHQTDTISSTNDIFNKFHKLTLNSFVLNNINLLNTEKSGDTIIALRNLNFSVNNIQIDSTTLITKIPDIDFKSIIISSGKIKLFEKKTGLSINLNNFNFTEDKGIASLQNVQISEQNLTNSHSLIIDVDSIGISQVSVKDIVYGIPIKIGLDIYNPLVDINILDKSNNSKKKLNLEKFEISEVKITNGNIHIFENNKLDIRIDNLNFNSGIIQLKNFDNLHEINSDNFALNTSSFKIELIKKDILVSVESINFLQNSFNINNISTKITSPNSIKTSISISQLDFEGFNLKEIINEKTISLNKFTISKPNVAGSIVLDSKLGRVDNQQQKLIFDYKINIDNFNINHGNIYLDINHENEEIKLSTGVNVVIDNIYLNNSADTTWLNKLLWNINLSKPAVQYKDYIISCKDIESDNTKELLILDNIEIHDNSSSKLTSGIDIRELTIENVYLSGLKYNTIINKQTPVINSIIIKKPHLDLKIDSRNKKHTKPTGQLNKKVLPFDIEDIEILNLSFKIENTDSISTSNVSLGKLDFKYNMSVTNNIINGFEHFSATNFLLSDSIKNSFSDIKRLTFSKENNQITISDLKGGSINKQLTSNNYLKYTSTGLSFKEIDITQTYPHNISIKEIDINDFDISIINHKNKNDSTKPTTVKKIKLPSLINSLKIDAITGDYFNITHLTISDTSEKKLTLVDLGFFINNIIIDSTKVSDTSFRFAENFSINLSKNKFVSKDSLYETSISSVNYNFYQNELTIDTLLMKPRFSSSDFFKKAIYQTGMMNIGVNKIICSNIRFEKLIKNGDIHIGGVNVYGLDMHIFRNKMYEMDPNLYKKMPQEALLSLSQIITIDSLKTHNSYILYKQINKKSIVPGEIFLNKVNLSVFNINNNLNVIDKTSSMVVYFNAMLLGEANTNIKLTMPILSPANDFWLSGHVDKIDFTMLNSMTQNLVGVTLKKGSGVLDIPLISGNSLHSKGLIAFKYRRLKIELYDRDKAQNASGLGGSMANLLLNDILIKSNNPGFLGKTRKGDVYFVRNTQKSIVAYTWKSILSGIMSTMGYNNKEQRQEKRAIKRSSK